MLIPRKTYLERIRPFIGKDLIKVITGIRRSGKSVLLQQIRDQIDSCNILFVNFEDLDNQHLLDYKAFHNHVVEAIGDTKGKHYLFFDEIQEVTGWEKAVNSLRVKFDVDIYVTGSNSKLLSGELATYIAGRYVAMTVFPFSLVEFNEAKGQSSFDEYITFGGMPFLTSINFDPDASRVYLEGLYSSIVLKDIIARNKIRDVDLLERIIQYALTNIGKSFSATSISNFFKNENRTVAPETILNYLKACEEAFLLYRFKSTDIKGKKLLRVNEKYYVADHGLREAVVGSNIKNIEIILENIVAIELLRRGYTITIGRIGDREVDFVGEKDGNKIYIQVCYLLNDETTVNREIRSLLGIEDNYPKYVLYKESLLCGNIQGIEVMRIDEWLLGNAAS
jgi:predicted AAA+ superfamily ATPase